MKQQDNTTWVVYVIIILMLMDGVSRFLAWDTGVGICNSGVSFGLLSGVDQTVMIFVEAVVVILVGWIGLRQVKKCVCAQRVGIYFVVAGGLSHIISRLIWGCVWDWIEYDRWGFYGDLADIMIDVGIIFIIVGSLKQLVWKSSPDEQDS